MRITANMVTLARIALLPIPAAILVWGDTFWVWMATVFAIALGATDAVDGYLARRDGPTVLGGLLDPVADKLFLAAFLLPITAKHHAPIWVVAVIFLRELMITALRSSMELRQQRLKTSQLGKVKTVVQMGGLAIYVFLLYTPEPFPKVLNALGVLGLLVVVGVFLARKRRPPFWVLPAIPLWALVLGLTYVLPMADVAYWLFIIIAVVTWVSGADYLWGAAKVYRQEGVSRIEAAKLFWAAANSAMLLLVFWHREALLPVMLTLGAHLALGGIDNIVTAQKSEPVRRGFLVPSLFSLAALTSSFLIAPGDWLVVVALSSAAAATGAFAAARAFLQHKELFFPQGAAGG